MTRSQCTAVAVVVAAAVVHAFADEPYQLQWTKQYGSMNNASFDAIRIDSQGNLYGCGNGFALKTDANGNLLWYQSRLESVSSSGLSLSTSGDVYVCGGGSLTQYSGGGQILASVPTTTEAIWAVTVTANGGICTTGPGYLTMYSSAGSTLAKTWEVPLSTGGTVLRQGNDISTDGDGNLYVAGYAGPDDGGLARFDSTGNLVWLRSFGRSDKWDGLVGVQVDALRGCVYTCGIVDADLGGRLATYHSDAILQKYTLDGDRLWSRTLSTPESDLNIHVDIDSTGGPVVGGLTYGSLAAPNAGAYDGLLAAYDADGNSRWLCQFGTEVGDCSNGIAVGPQGDIYAGLARSPLTLTDPPSYIGGIYIAKYQAVPEPSTLFLTLLSGLCLLRRRTRPPAIAPRVG